jgi:hypothetical protein
MYTCIWMFIYTYKFIQRPEFEESDFMGLWLSFDYVALLMVESSMYACALPIILTDQIVWLVEHKHTYLTLPSTKLHSRRIIIDP